MAAVKAKILALTKEEIYEFKKNTTIEIEGFTLDLEDILVKSSYAKLEEAHLMLDGNDDLCIVLDTQ